MLTISTARLCKMVIDATKADKLIPDAILVNGWNVLWRDFLTPKQIASIEAVASMHVA